jgi:signal transduction histidine kinase/CheY-like chemotaxis protein
MCSEDEEDNVTETGTSSSGSASSSGFRSRGSLTISTFPLIKRLDDILKVPGDNRADRLQKVSAFLMAMFSGSILVVFFVASIAFGWGAFGLTMLGGVAAGLFGVGALLIRTKNARYAFIYAHFTAVFLAVIFPVIIILRNGVALVNDNGDPHMYQFTYCISVPAIIAFLLRSRFAFFCYSCINLSWLIVGPLWNPRGGDVTAALPAHVTTIVSYLIVSFSLSMFMDVAMALSDDNESAAVVTEIAVAEARAERRANLAKTRFVSVMSHEIRNPLQAILLQLEMLELSNLSKGQRDYVAGITRASNSLLTIVNDILEVTKIESGALTLEATPVVLRDVVEFTVHSYAPAAANKGVELVVSIDPTLNTSVVADPTRLRQVLRNLLSNALKFTEAGEVEVTVDKVVEVRDAADDDDRDTWALRVRDTGIGIDDEGKAKLFQEFSQVDETTTRLYGGTGLGLFICKELCELMGGSVSVESTAGSGSTFTAKFRAQQSEDGSKEAPVCVVASETKWTVLVHASNDTLRRVVGCYAAYFFSGVSDVKILYSDKVRTGEARVGELIRDCSPTNRLVAIANYTDCTSGLLALLASHTASVCVPIMLSSGAAGLFADDPFPIESWQNIVQKPVTARQLCSTIERAIADVGTSGSDSLSLSASHSSRHITDGTTTRGVRLPSSDEMAAASAEQAAARPGHSTILVADDFDLIRSLVQELVSEMGFNTLVAANGKKAVELVREHYDSLSLVLMDCEMPILDGYSATEEIRRYEQERGIPPSKQLYVCAMTANAMQGDAKKCYANHMSGFVAKPVRRVELQDKLRQHAQLPSERGIGGGKVKRKPKRKKKKGDNLGDDQ